MKWQRKICAFFIRKSLNLKPMTNWLVSRFQFRFLVNNQQQIRWKYSAQFFLFIILFICFFVVTSQKTDYSWRFSFWALCTLSLSVCLCWYLCPSNYYVVSLSSDEQWAMQKWRNEKRKTVTNHVKTSNHIVIYSVQLSVVCCFRVFLLLLCSALLFCNKLFFS